MSTTLRIGRVCDVLQRELSDLIRKDCRDPRIGFVTISGVEVSRDLAYAKIFITVLNDAEILPSIAALNKAAGFMRSGLAKKLSLRVVPKIVFYHDQSYQTGSKIDKLLASIKNAATV
jgi:ribosome-binding factor A